MKQYFKEKRPGIRERRGGAGGHRAASTADGPDAQRADDASKVVDRGAWRLTPSLFAEVVRRLGKVVVDCFADEENHQLPEFHSRGWSPSAARFDTFTASWMRRPTAQVAAVIVSFGENAVVDV